MNTIKWAAIGALALIVLGALGYAEYRVYAAGESHVQAEWDAEKSAQAQAVEAQAVKASNTEKTQSAAFAGIEMDYIRDSPYANAIASSTADAVSAGTLRVRFCDAAARAGGHSVPAATAGSRAADAAATQALADRASAAVAAVRAGDDADAREQQLRTQVIALQAVLKAERTKP